MLTPSFFKFIKLSFLLIGVFQIKEMYNTYDSETYTICTFLVVICTFLFVLSYMTYKDLKEMCAHACIILFNITL